MPCLAWFSFLPVFLGSACGVWGACLTISLHTLHGQPGDGISHFLGSHCTGKAESISLPKLSLILSLYNTRLLVYVGGV